MAVTEFADFIKTVRSTYATTVSDGILEDFVIFKELQKANGRPAEYDGLIQGKAGFWKNVGGDNFEWRLMYDKIEAQEWGPGSTVTATTPDILKSAKDSMGGYRVGYFVDMYESLSMNTPEQYVPLMKLYEKMAARRWYTLWEEKILKNSTTGGWKGFPNWVGTIAGAGSAATTSGTYATNIDLSQSYASPALFNYDGSGQSFAVTCLDRVNEVATKATHGDSQGGADTPTVGFVRRDDWNTMRSVIEDQHRLINTNTEMLKFGFSQFTYNGIRFYWSFEMQDQAVKRVYLLNMHHLGVAHASPKMIKDVTATSITGQVGVVAMSFNKSQHFTSNSKKQGIIANTDLS